MQFQVELPHSFGEFRPKLIGIRFAVEDGSASTKRTPLST